MEIRRQLYAGRTIVFRQLPAALKLCTYFKSRVLHHFANNDNNGTPLDPATVVEMCKAFEAAESDAISLWKAIINEAEVHLNSSTADVLWDRIRLRVQQSGDTMDDVADAKYRSGRFSSTLELHRDTWASNVQQQLNWWIPLTPITAGRTLALYPSFFDVHVANTSKTWSVQHVRNSRKNNEAYPQLPVVQYDALSAAERERIALDRMPVVIHPGDVLVFSGAHLHGSVLNTTGVTRFSSEVRTVDKGDVDKGVGAVNVDGESEDYNLSWFRPIDTAS